MVSDKMAAQVMSDQLFARRQEATMTSEAKASKGEKTNLNREVSMGGNSTIG